MCPMKKTVGRWEKLFSMLFSQSLICFHVWFDLFGQPMILAKLGSSII